MIRNSFSITLTSINGLFSLSKPVKTLSTARKSHNFNDIEPKYTFDLDSLLEEGTDRDFKPPHFLFMTDFCGSTLLANALGKLRGVSCLYEVRAFVGLAIRSGCWTGIWLRDPGERRG